MIDCTWLLQRKGAYINWGRGGWHRLQSRGGRICWELGDDCSVWMWLSWKRIIGLVPDGGQEELRDAGMMAGWPAQLLGEVFGQGESGETVWTFPHLGRSCLGTQQCEWDTVNTCRPKDSQFFQSCSWYGETSGSRGQNRCLDILKNWKKEAGNDKRL